MSSLQRCAVVASFVLAACAGDGGDDDGAGGPSVSSNATPQELCAQRCQLQVDAGCAKTPANYLEGCTAVCLAKYTSFPMCEEAMRALDVCSIEQIHYGCAEGVLDVQPKGGCASPAATCFGCTQDFMGCL